MPTAETGTLVGMSSPKVGAFVLDVGSLTPGTTYYVRAFAENAKGVVYGDEELEFKTEEADMTLKGNAGPLLIGGTAEVPLNTNPTTEDIIDTSTTFYRSRAIRRRGTTGLRWRCSTFRPRKPGWTGA